MKQRQSWLAAPAIPQCLRLTRASVPIRSRVRQSKERTGPHHRSAKWSGWVRLYQTQGPTSKEKCAPTQEKFPEKYVPDVGDERKNSPGAILFKSCTIFSRFHLFLLSSGGNGSNCWLVESFYNKPERENHLLNSYGNHQNDKDRRHQTDEIEHNQHACCYHQCGSNKSPAGQPPGDEVWLVKNIIIHQGTNAKNGWCEHKARPVTSCQ